jgi:hypothetical protein
MSLSCECDTDWYPEPGDIVWNSPGDYTELKTKRRCRCISCKELIDIGAITIEFPRFKVPDGEIEERIYGEDGEIPRASFYMCETCADIYFSISELGYCLDDWDMRQALKDYQQLQKLGFTS